MPHYVPNIEDMTKQLLLIAKEDVDRNAKDGDIKFEDGAVYIYNTAKWVRYAEGTPQYKFAIATIGEEPEPQVEPVNRRKFRLEVDNKESNV